jgi:uncharacterized protein (DUF2062 family)
MEIASVLLVGAVLLAVLLLWKISIFWRKHRSDRMKKRERCWLDL